MQEEISFGEWLRKQRRALDLSRQALADQAGCAEVTLRRIEAGTLKPSKELANILLEKLGLSETERPKWISFARGLSGVPAKLPPTSNKLVTNLPAPLTTFIGRERQLSEVIRLITKHRLITLTGSGGVGKTRLSIKVGEQIAGDFPNGVWLVELASILDPLLVPRTVAIAVGLRDEPQRPVIDMLSDFLREKNILIILDNCEHLLDSCAQLADTLLKRCPDLKILATSREVLGILGEATYRVPSLELPDLQKSPKDIRRYESARLFEERAQLVRTDFSLTIENAPSVAKICSQLDGIPLAIELAAAHVSIFSPGQIEARLEKRFNLLTTGNRTALPRHQTLRAAIDWSYDLLSPGEKSVLQRLSVFINGWTLEAAESISSDANIKPEDMWRLLAQLTNKSLVTIEESQVGRRYHMLETVRQYASEKLLESGENDALRDRHLDYFLYLAETTGPHLIRPEQLEWLPLLDADYENLRLALEWALSKGSAKPSLRLCSALGMFWVIRCYSVEGAKRLASALAKPERKQDRAEKALRVRALYQDAELAQQLDDLERMRTSSELSLKLAQQGSDQRDLAIARFYLGFALYRVGDFNKARAYLEQSFTEFEELDEPYWKSYTYKWLGTIRFNQGELTYIEHALHNLELARKAGERLNLVVALYSFSYCLSTYGRTAEAKKHLKEAEQLSKQISLNTESSIFVLVQIGLAEIEWLDGNHQQARALYMESQERLRLVGDKMMRSTCITDLGLLSMEEGDLMQAQAFLEEALSIVRELDVEFFNAKALMLLSILSYLQGNIEKSKQNFRESISLTNDLSPYRKAYFLESMFISPYFQMPENSVQLLGVIGGFHERFNTPISPFVKRYCVRAEAHARESLGDEAFESAFAEGQNMSLDEALDLALKTVEEM